MPMGDSPVFVSVIVPAYNAHTVLPVCLQSLSEQTYPASHYEIIVVDNGSNPSLQPVVERFPQVRYLSELKPGSYAARNHALTQARGQILAFTDADCIPAPDWIETGVCRLLNTPGCGLIGGNIRLTFKKPGRPTFLELCDYLSYGGFPQRVFVEKRRFAATGNAFTTRAMMDEIGPFDASLMSGGDRDWGNRVAAAGHSVVYGAEVVVEHPARATLRELIKKSRRLQGGARDYRRKKTGSVKSESGPLKWLLIPAFARLLLKDYRTFRTYRDKHGQPLRVPPHTILLAVMTVWLLRAIRTGESIRLKFGGPSSRG